MRVFVSWSGDRSRAAAQALRDWLPLVLHYVQPWMSATDIDAGQRWSTEVGQQLSESSFGILCLTRENLLAPWILFEAGALAKSLTTGAVVPYLIEGEFSDITGPLAQFQAKKADENSTRELLQALNGRAQQPIPQDRLDDLFDMAWARLEVQLSKIPKSPSSVPPARKERDILEELVQVIRTVERRTRSLEQGANVSVLDEPVASSWEAEARRIAASGNMVAAIKAARQAAGMSLKEAHDLVQSWRVPVDWEVQARALALDGNEVAAIALIREHTQGTLRNAKAHLKRLLARAP